MLQIVLELLFLGGHVISTSICFIWSLWHNLYNNILLLNDNDNDNELFIQTKSNEKHHKGNINNTYKNINIATFVPRRLHLKTSWPLAYNHL